MWPLIFVCVGNCRYMLGCYTELYAYAHKQPVPPTAAEQGQRMPKESKWMYCLRSLQGKEEAKCMAKDAESSCCVAATTSQQYHQLPYFSCRLVWLSYVSAQPVVVLIPWWGDARPTCPGVFCGTCRSTAWILHGMCVGWGQLEAGALCSLARLFCWRAAAAVWPCGSICHEAAGLGLSAHVCDVGAVGKE